MINVLHIREHKRRKEMVAYEDRRYIPRRQTPVLRLEGSSGLVLNSLDLSHAPYSCLNLLIVRTFVSQAIECTRRQRRTNRESFSLLLGFYTIKSPLIGAKLDSNIDVLS